MDPALPALPDPSLPGPGDRSGRVPGDPGHDGAGYDVGYDVGAFEQGTPASRWALARYLVGRALGESIGRSLLVVAVVVLALAVLVQRAGSTFWAVVIAVIALGILALRALLAAILRRLTAADLYAPAEQRLRAMVADTRRGVLAELRRLGLPGRTWTLPLLGVRLLRRRTRGDTVARLRGFAVDNVVSAARVDELHLLLREAAGHPHRPAG